MVEYQKETVAKLTEILKSRSLPTSGKKAELVARLQEADQAAQANEAEAAPPAPSTSAPPEQDPSTIAQESAAPEAKPAAQTETATTGDPSAGAEGTDGAPKPDYSLHLPTSTIDAELEKRKARAARFGTSAAASAATGGDAAETNGAAENNTTTEQERALARAQRFGLSAAETTTVGKLDVALSSEKPKGRRHGPKEGENGNTGGGGGATFDDPGLLRRGGRGGRFGRGGGGGRGGGRNRREGSAGAKPTGVEKRGAGYSDADRKAAEARKARFGQG